MIRFPAVDSMEINICFISLVHSFYRWMMCITNLQNETSILHLRVCNRSGKKCCPFCLLFLVQSACFRIFI